MMTRILQYHVSADELRALLDWARQNDDVRLLARCNDRCPPPHFRYPENVVDARGAGFLSEIVLWNATISPEPTFRLSKAADNVFKRDLLFLDTSISEVAELGGATGRGRLHTYDLRSDAFMKWYASLVHWFKQRCRYDKEKRVWLSKALLGADPGARVEDDGAETRHSGRDRSHRTAQESCQWLQQAVGLEGSPHPRVRHRPRYDDDPQGPSLFRTDVADQRFERITLPGLYIGRSELSDVSFAGAKLYRSTFNWSDFTNVDFSACDLHDSDLRASNFEKCAFAGANLKGCDLRGSAFAQCSLDGAKLDGAVGLEDQRVEFGLSDAQAASMTWTSDYEEPDDD